MKPRDPARVTLPIFLLVGAPSNVPKCTKTQQCGSSSNGWDAERLIADLRYVLTAWIAMYKTGTCNVSSKICVMPAPFWLVSTF